MEEFIIIDKDADAMLNILITQIYTANFNGRWINTTALFKNFCTIIVHVNGKEK
jgi:hypothetical protein